MFRTIKNIKIKIALLILLQSIIYLSVFITLFFLAKKPVVSLISIIPLSIISWRYGRVAGCITTILNSFLTIVTIHTLDPGGFRFLTIEPFMGLAAQLLFALTVGTFSSMAKSLRKENAERKLAETQLREYKDHLEEIVHQRTEQLDKTNARLRQIEKMEVIGQLAGGIAHDFNNQLSIVLGYCEILNRNLENDPKLLNYLAQIQTASNRATALTKQLLAFARKDVYKMQAVNVHDIISEVMSLLAHTINKNIKIEHSFTASKSYIWGGANQIQNAILNLAINARDAMPDGGTLTFTTEDIEIDDEFNNNHTFKLHKGSYVSINIKDTGTGMSAHVVKHLFEPFFTTKEEGKGTGMGLAATYGIIKSHKGAIDVTTVEGQGTTFTLYLQVTNKPHDSDIIQKVKSWDGKKLNVLIIDDERLVALTIKDILESPDVNVHVAFSGDDAIRIYREQWEQIDIVIVDMIMSGMNGRQTFTELKKINPKIKAIISSGFALNLEIEQTLKEGAQAFIQKPYNRSELFDYIERVMVQG